MLWGQPCDPNSRTTIKLFGNTDPWVKAGIGHIKYAELLALKTKYGRWLAERHAEDGTQVQTYACRKVRGSTSTWSYHAWPRALDIRPSANPMRDDGVLVTDFARSGLLDGIRFVSAFLAAGFNWGTTWDATDQTDRGDWVGLTRWMLLRNGEKVRAGRVDPMHFELDDDVTIRGPEYWVRRVRRYALRHPVYISRVKEAAGVKTIRALVKAWYDGRA